MQFTLQTLLVSFVVVASALAAFDGWGLPVAAVILAAAAYIRSHASPRRAAWHVLAALLVLLLPMGGCDLLLPSFGTPPSVTRRFDCMNRMREIAIALDNYQLDHGHFPPAFVLGPDGKPWHSWRTLLLPYLGHKPLHSRYHFDEPWNGPNNRQLAAVDVPCYTCPADEKHTAGHTSYVAVVGSETAWPGEKGLRRRQMRDGAGRTIILVETQGDHIGWSEPRDLSFEEACRGVDPQANGIAGNHRHATYFDIYEPRTIVALADGNVRVLDAGPPPADWRAWLTAAGGEDIEVRSVLRATAHPRWGRIGGLICLVLSTLLLLLRPIRRSSDVSAFADNRASDG